MILCCRIARTNPAPARVLSFSSEMITPKFIHPIRAVRSAVGEANGARLSQSAFARLVGTRPATIQNIELGRLGLSPSLANRICVATGADPYSLLDQRGRP